MQNNRLGYPLWELAPLSGKSWIRHCSGFSRWTNLSYLADMRWDFRKKKHFKIYRPGRFKVTGFSYVLQYKCRPEKKRVWTPGRSLWRETTNYCYLCKIISAITQDLLSRTVLFLCSSYVLPRASSLWQKSSNSIGILAQWTTTETPSHRLLQACGVTPVI